MDKKIDDWIEYIPDRPNNDKKYSIDSTKSAKELGWKKETSFEDGISKTIDWYIKNQKWLNDITNENYKTAYEEWSNKNDSF